MKETTTPSSQCRAGCQGDQTKQTDRIRRASHAHDSPGNNRRREKASSTPTSQRGNDKSGDHTSSKINPQAQGEEILNSDVAGQETKLRDSPQDAQHDNIQKYPQETVDPRTARSHQDTKKSNSGFLGSITSFWSNERASGHSESINNYIRELEARSRHQAEELNEAVACIDKLEARDQRHKNELNEQKNQLEALFEERSRFQVHFKSLISQLEAAKKELKQQEAIVTNMRTRQIADLASEVSSEFPDDKAREALQTFFQGDFFSWCSDLCIPVLEASDQTEARLHSAKLLNNSESYLNAPRFLKMNLRLGDGEASWPLLQAALSRFLCRQFLKTPYFLADMRPDLLRRRDILASSGLDAIESTFQKVQLDTAIDWRINTVTALERVIPMTLEAAEHLAKSFFTNFRFLINDAYEDDNEARGDLVKMIIDFANISLRLWKNRGNIKVSYIRDFATIPFQRGSNFLEANAQAVSALGSQTDGRPIGLLIRPLIVSHPPRGANNVQTEVVLIKGLAWISSLVDEDKTKGQ